MNGGQPCEERFTALHFNAIYGLDICIGDYKTADPLPAGMLKKIWGTPLLDFFPDQAEQSAPKVTLIQGVTLIYFPLRRIPRKMWHSCRQRQVIWLCQPAMSANMTTLISTHKPTTSLQAPAQACARVEALRLLISRFHRNAGPLQKRVRFNIRFLGCDLPRIPD